MTSINTRVDQQDTNAALAALAATGDAFALGQLWEINKGLLRSMFWKWYPSHKSLADKHGMTTDDFEQEGYFAVKYAAEHYDPGKGVAFSTWLTYAMKRQIQQTLDGGHRRNIIGLDGKTRQVSANPLDHCTSLDIQLDTEDDGSATLGDLQADPAAVEAFQDAEERIYQEELHAALEEALCKLSDREEMVVRSRFYGQMTLEEIAAVDGTSRENVRQITAKAFRNLRSNPRLRRWHDEIISSRAWHGTGFIAWAYSGSVEERTVEYLDNYKRNHFL